MEENKKEMKSEINPADSEVKEQAEYTPFVQSDFLREKIKQKPVNKKKLLRRTIITAVMAVVFGIVACLTFLLLEPVINNWLYPEEEAQQVQFPEETVTEEMNPEDMLTEEAVEEENETVALEDEQIEELLSKVQFGVEEYRMLYDELVALAKDVGRSLVTVTGVTSDVDWFNNTYENEATTSGVIVANNGRAILILANADNLLDAESIVVTFCDQKQVEAEFVQGDATTGFAILSVPLLSVEEETMDVINIASLGSSNANNLLGSPIIALGSPLGSSNSVCYGVITSSGTLIDQADSAYKLITTDIYGSRNATGVIVNMNGMVIGIIDNSYNSEDRANLISAYGISELKRTIEKMSNEEARAYLGVHGTDVPAEAAAESDIPMGAYIKEIEMDSPAMIAGIQSGDVIIQFGDTTVTCYNELLDALHHAIPGEFVNVTIMRQGADSYREMTVEVNLGEQ